MQNYYQFMVARLNGAEIRSRFGAYLSLVKEGIAGFIIFGGELETVRTYVQRLQEASSVPLIIASDLERGLGQQLKGGTHFPPSMALAQAFGKDCRSGIHPSPRLLRRSFRALADEAAYAGINTVLAPVLDINTNPKNPIIAARAFGEDKETVAYFGCEMIKTLQRYGITACGKHFPGHGDTGVDSHIRLPVIDRDLGSLKKNELYPFKKAIGAGVKMIMLGHLGVPALDRSGLPVSLSEPAVRFLRKNLRFSGIIITDAMNMGGIGKYSEERASDMALRAGVDIILHPSEPGKISYFLTSRKRTFDAGRVTEFRIKLVNRYHSEKPDFGKNRDLSEMLTEKGIRISGKLGRIKTPFLLVLNDEAERRYNTFVKRFRANFPGAKTRIIDLGTKDQGIVIPGNASVIAAIFSETKGWKGGAVDSLYTHLSHLEDRADLFISFGSPYLLDNVTRAAKMFVYWDSEPAQKAAADVLLKLSSA